MTTIWSGLVIGALYSLVAIGYNTVLLASGVFNFAHGQLIMLATYASFLGSVTFHLPWPLTVLFATIAVAVVAIVEERVAIRPLLARRDIHAALITTVGASTVMSGLAEVTAGSDPKQLAIPISNDPLTILGGVIAPMDLLLIIATLAIGLGIHFWSRRSLLGIASLAVAENRDAASVRGIDTKLLGVGAFAVAGGIAGATGLLVGAHTYAIPSLGNSLALFGFVAIAIGGAGSQLGGLLGGFITGIIFALSARYIGSDYPQIVVFGVFLAVLLTRPRGIFGRAMERVV
ncbi:branched-chain amino acid ABC transporter permease [Paractinoplanes globisporus]|uniref:Branched-chain amino acid ABC transporter permease n=1 Tax=Paractinoplanes globisporus TaxID=113565 RepID=A0ABW6W8C4_9ACTN|nr:branched-chain amino acid ABC transporter permease [Actinoplanes globisporus]